MKRIITLLVAVVLLLTGALLDSWMRPVHAQTATQLEFSYVAAHASCVPAPSTTVFCFAADSGIWISLDGATTFTQIGATATAGVTSWNGLTGAVTFTPPPAPVTSVNGKTGAVVISATTTSSTTLQ